MTRTITTTDGNAYVFVYPSGGSRLFNFRRSVMLRG